MPLSPSKASLVGIWLDEGRLVVPAGGAVFTCQAIGQGWDYMFLTAHRAVEAQAEMGVRAVHSSKPGCHGGRCLYCQHPCACTALGLFVASRRIRPPLHKEEAVAAKQSRNWALEIAFRRRRLSSLPKNHPEGNLP